MMAAENVVLGIGLSAVGATVTNLLSRKFVTDRISPYTVDHRLHFAVGRVEEAPNTRAMVSRIGEGKIASTIAGAGEVLLSILSTIGGGISAHYGSPELASTLYSAAGGFFLTGTTNLGLGIAGNQFGDAARLLIEGQSGYNAPVPLDQN